MYNIMRFQDSVEIVLDKSFKEWKSFSYIWLNRALMIIGRNIINAFKELTIKINYFLDWKLSYNECMKFNRLLYFVMLALLSM